MNDLQTQIDILARQVAQLSKSSTISRDDETALRERLGLSGNSQPFPIGSIFISTVTDNPASLLGYGTWVAFGAGQVLVGYNSGDPDFGTLLGTGGEKTHTLTISEMPSHDHTGNYASQVWNTNGANGTTSLNGSGTAPNTTPGIVPQGGGTAHNNIQPYITVNFWKRTA